MNVERDTQLMRILKVSEIRHLIAHTNKGDLTLMLRFGEDKYNFLLDACPMDEETNDELLNYYGRAN